MTNFSRAGFRDFGYGIVVVLLCFGVCRLCRVVGETEPSAFMACEVALGVGDDLVIVYMERDG